VHKNNNLNNIYVPQDCAHIATISN